MGLSICCVLDLTSKTVNQKNIRHFYNIPREFVLDFIQPQKWVVNFSLVVTGR